MRISCKGLRADITSDKSIFQLNNPGSVLCIFFIVCHLDDRHSFPMKLLKQIHDDLALRREEAVSLDLEHIDLESGTVAILGKGRTERERLTLPEPTKTALAAWLEVRGDEPGALFLNVDRAAKGKRLTGRSVHRILGGLGRKAGIQVRPHGLKHARVGRARALIAVSDPHSNCLDSLK